MASTVVDELITLLSLEGDPANEEQARKFSKAVESIESVAKKAGAALLASTAAIGAWTLKTSAAVDESGKFAESLGISFEKLQELEFAAGRVGGSVSELRGDIETLQTQFGGFESADQTLERLAQQFDGLSNVEAQMLGKNFGLSETTVRLLQRGSEGLADLRQQARALGGIIPDEATRQAADFEDQLTNIRFALKGMAVTATVSVLPALTDIAEGFTEFITKNRDGIQNFIADFISGFTDGFDRFAQIVASAGSTISQFLGPLGEMVSTFEMADVVSAVVLTTLVGLGAVLIPIAVKIGAIIAAVTALSLVVEDFIVFLNGGKSLIGTFFDGFAEKFPEIAALVQNLGVILGSVFDIVKQFAEARFQQIIDELTMFKNIMLVTLDLINMAIKGLRLLSEAAFNPGDFFGDNFAADATGFIKSLFQATPAEGGVSPGSVAPVSSSIVNQQSTTNNGGETNIFVNGSGNPAAVAEQVVQRGGLRNVQQTITPGIEAPVVG